MVEESDSSGDRFVASLTELDKEFVKFFLSKQVCWRCIFMMFRQTELDLYRNREQFAQLKQQDTPDPVATRHAGQPHGNAVVGSGG